MVNASLNWASIVGIVLAVCGGGLYFLRSFKPALARDYDVFFAAIGLLCGGILFFQGWRLDPILQFGQFLLARKIPSIALLLEDASFCRSFKYTIYIGYISTPLKINFGERMWSMLVSIGPVLLV